MADNKATFIIEVDDRTRKALASMRKRFNDTGKSIVRWATGIASVAGPTTLGLLTKRSMDAIDVQAKFADRIGISTDKLASLQHMANETGVKNEQLNMGLQRMTRRVAEAARGTGEAVGALNELGISASDLAKMSPDQQFEKISKAMQNVPNQADRVRLAFKLFDSEGVGLVNTLDKLADEGLAKTEEQMRAIGVAMDRVDAAKVEAANDAWGRAMKVIEGLGNRLAVAVSPIITALADKFFNAAVESKGFGDTVSRSMEWAAKAVAFVADTIRGVQVAFKAAQLVGTGFAAAVLTVIEQLSGQMFKFQRMFIDGLNRMISAANKLPGVELDLIDTSGIDRAQQLISTAAEATREKVGELRSELHEMAMQPLPGDGVKKFFEDAAVAAQQAAEQVGSSKASMIGADGEGLTDKEREALTRKVEAVNRFLMSETEKVSAEYQERKDAVMAAYDAGIIESEQQKNAILLELNERLQEELTAIEKKGLTEREKFNRMSWAGQVKTVAGALEDMTAGVANHSKTMFKINKAAAIANAIVNTAEGVTKALTAYPPPLSFVMAAAQLAAGMAQVQAIRATQFGGGTTPSKAGSTPTYNGQPVGSSSGASPSGAGQLGGGQAAPQPERVVIDVQGLTEDALYSGRSVDRMIQAINERVGDGVRVTATVGVRRR